MKPMDRYEIERQKNREKRMEAILDAAEPLFAEKGIENTTMQDIATAANLGVATVFRIYPKKEKIAVGAATRKLKKILTVFEEIQEREATSLEKIEALLDHFLKELQSDEKDDIKIIEDFDIYSTRLTEPIEDIEQYKKVYREISRTYATIIKQGLEDNSIRSDINIEESLITLINTFATFARKLSIHKSIFFIELDLEPEKQLEILKKIIMDYLRG